ncbi:MAG: methyltransferase domain-containing protein [Chloroflexi bacterium]|nr:methyltransferase domain-containing protein [Chloroflexota bacterium]
MIDEPPVDAAPERPIAEYDLRYRDVFWADRDYEDRCDRIAIRALLPPAGDRLIEVGAGFGRLADEYGGYRSITLFDPSVSLLDAARERLGVDPKYLFVAGDAHQLPFEDGSFDAVVCVRVVHNLADPGQVFREFARVLKPGGVLVMEFANKRHLKSILRWATRRQRWSPFNRQAHEYLPLHWDRSPAEIRDLLETAGLRITRTRTASLFRLPALRRRVSSGTLSAIERPLQAPLGLLAVGPSVFLRARRRPS